MFVKKFEARSLEQALAQVKEEFGPNALILSTEQGQGKWYQKPWFKVMAAAEKRTIETSHRFSSSKKEEEEGFDERTTEESSKGSVRKSRLERYIDLDPLPQGPRNEFGLFEQTFLKCGFSQETSREFSRRLKEDYPKRDLAKASFLERAKIKILSNHIRTLSPDALLNHSQWVALGVAGSGKTSLLVKLALYFRKRGRSVSLHGTDPRKVVGKSEMASYARLLNVSFAPDAERSGGEIKFVDRPALDFTADPNNGFNTLLDHQAGILVLDSTMRFQELCRILERSSSIRPSAIAFTKLDLASQYGVIVDVLRRARLPLLGASLSSSFKSEFKFFDPTELAVLILKSRGIA